MLPDQGPGQRLISLPSEIQNQPSLSNFVTMLSSTNFFRPAGADFYVAGAEEADDFARAVEAAVFPAYQPHITLLQLQLLPGVLDNQGLR